MVDENVLSMETIENNDFLVHHVPSSDALSSSSSKLPFVHQFLLNFSSSLHTLSSSNFQQLLCDHGIPMHDTDVHLSQMALLHHLVNGLCIYGLTKGCSSIISSSGAFFFFF